MKDTRSLFPIAAVIFDMDGLIFDTERLAIEAWVAAGARSGYEIDHEVVVATVGLAKKETSEVFARTYGDAFPFDAIRAERLKIATQIIERDGPPLKKGIEGLLRFLEERAIPMAVATSTDRQHVRFMFDACGFTRYFSVTVCGDEVTRNKPDPEIFLKAAQALNTDPRSCLVLEDSPYGIMAAHSAGMRSIIVPDLVVPAPDIVAMTEGVCEDLDQVRAFLDGEGLLAT